MTFAEFKAGRWKGVLLYRSSDIVKRDYTSSLNIDQYRPWDLWDECLTSIESRTVFVSCKEQKLQDQLINNTFFVVARIFITFLACEWPVYMEITGYRIICFTVNTYSCERNNQREYLCVLLRPGKTYRFEYLNDTIVLVLKIIRFQS